MTTDKHTMESFQVGNSSWWVFAKAGKDGDLQVFVSHAGQPEVVGTGNSLGRYGEWGERFTTRPPLHTEKVFETGGR